MSRRGFRGGFFSFRRTRCLSGSIVGGQYNMNKLSERQCTLAVAVEFSGFGVHSGQPATLMIDPLAADSGLKKIGRASCRERV